MPATPYLHDQENDLAFPLLYQAQHRDYVADIPFWLDLGRLNGDPILELGCGTGRVLIPLAKAGHTIYGLDNSIGMLKVCRQQVTPANATRIHIYQSDLTAFKFDIRFPLIILPCNTYSTLDEDNRKAALACIYDHLRSDGVFAVSLTNPRILTKAEITDQAEIETSFPHPETGDPVQVSYEITRTAQQINLVWHYDHLKSNGQVSRLTETTSHQLLAVDQFQDEFLRFGFSIQAIYGDFDYSLLKPESPELIIVAKKV